MSVVNGLIWKHRIYKLIPNKSFKRFCTDKCVDIKNEIITHSYKKTEYEQNINKYKQCKDYIDLKQKIYYDYLSKETPTLSISRGKQMNEYIINNENEYKNYENSKNDKKNVQENHVSNLYENIRMGYIEEYKKWSKIIKKKKKELEKNVDKDILSLNESKQGIEENINTKYCNNNNSNNANISEINAVQDEKIGYKHMVYIQNNDDEFIKCENEGNNKIEAGDNDILKKNSISSSLTEIYIDNSKYFNNEDYKIPNIIKLNQYCSYKGLCSSRFAYNNLKKGILKINDNIVYENVDISIGKDRVELTKVGKLLLKDRITIIVNKPKHYLSISPDNKLNNKKLLVRNLIRNENKYIEEEHKCMSYFIYKNINIEKVNNLYVCGRLDANSTGLLIYTQDSMASSYLLNKYKYEVEKEYIITTFNEINECHLKMLKDNLFVDGKLIYKCHIQYVDSFTLIFKLYQGFHKIIRKICLLSNIKIRSLHRTRIGKIHLNNLPLGKWRFLMPNESFF
ncbi:RNA pseudouridylate synthase, putative [Plasmodium berghei]|uniref:RNA pseudouridylate synthase, putative n=2 Tax=Plasmodium berghei TaxID=5821 RepID=A0A509ATF6_PLABA|nr:RNA pseudouridylate synthase, putative [Plasmodium berghei ANKA]CXJ23416.1 RNA pseudouridylate synthase, putative [Plasmodium berghei]SCM26727.1 RNA pseudouridylate synthase, putative [Plasmodium berghei]SCN28606.1 RNA pseudouridylate synthase, putative [Plasmodium berghei]SCO62796.1 RNA pseudouridylate synthase, putative [Plasmodium berghei]SCO64354.1 RNA pseudouridylate synthase, putative [Plasmodium berghei]|eukprot:XP_034424250.1 RNA pseudouridylate synthase, putative [Plasmodium berghei ANKA]